MVVETAEPEKFEGVCGVVMPISAMDGYPEEHWSDVLEIISDAIRSAKFSPNLVSSSEDIGVIQKRIIQNLYENPIVVCDVSGKNPNVMFELGIRLAFDKPTIIIKDDKTSYSFDTSPIEHITYPKDLRFNEVVRFKEKLTDKIVNTIKKSMEDKDFTPFLGHFGTFKVAKIDSKEVSGDEYIIDQLRDIKLMLSSNRISSRHDLVEIDGIARSGVKLEQFARDAKRVIRKFLRERNLSPKDVTMENDELVHIVEMDAKAPEYFRNSSEFRSYLSLVITTMY